jgi:hypothetical protein
MLISGAVSSVVTKLASAGEMGLVFLAVGLLTALLKFCLALVRRSSSSSGNNDPRPPGVMNSTFSSVRKKHSLKSILF